ncbi:MAG: TetR/AcrR family transcriptional regulator [Alphaproteobacteria bacterium]|nr:TetR/AcrR family transcriptional regulator [Alphaproteobacteria bacterium]
MPAPLLPRDEVVQRLTQVIREHGYDGATLSRMSQATGLGKASLYHYFPRGKEQIAEEVLARAGDWLEEHAIGPLAEAGPPRARLERLARALSTFYAGGETACLLDLLSVGGSGEVFSQTIKASLERIETAIAAVLVEADLAPDAAARRAEDAVIGLQGALVVSRAKRSTEPFRRVLADLPNRLLTGSETAH